MHMFRCVSRRDEQHDVALNTGWRDRMNDVGSSQFPLACYVTSHDSNPGYSHTPCSLCLCGDKDSNLG